MDNAECPLLGALNEENTQQPGIDYPSFENRCFADAAYLHTPLMLADQATYCLSGSYHLCPRFQASQVEQESRISVPRGSDSNLPIPPVDPGWESEWAVAPPPIDATIQELWVTMGDDKSVGGWTADLFNQPLHRDRSPLWLSAVCAFIFVFLCGITTALYTGWQLVSNNLLAAQPEPGTITTLALPQNRAAPADVYIVMTATSSVPLHAPEPGEETAPTVGAVLVGPTATFAFPIAVTPTPNISSDSSGDIVPTPIVVDLESVQAPENDAQGQPEQAALTEPNSVPVILPPTPTLRPTPVFELPLNAPLPDVTTPTPTLSPTATFGPPFVIFTAEDEALNEGECTAVRWEVKNVAEVYYEDRGVFGKGEEEECIGDEDEVYDLVVRLHDGSTQVYTTTVALILPTPTPEPTATFTPEPLPSPTWTPHPPTPTPTPNVTRGILLASDGDTDRACTRGATCEFGLFATNSGDATDTIAVLVARSDGAPPILCRSNGVCASEGRLEFANVDPNLTAYVTVRLAVPLEQAPTTISYVFRAVSVLSGEQIASDSLTIKLDIQ